ncbi:MAG: tail fiber domain-containing protein [Oligoflexia bacterium]|nr:tail fiber domain-containing protein [Oligoflexia bacterium]
MSLKPGKQKKLGQGGVTLVDVLVTMGIISGLAVLVGALVQMTTRSQTQTTLVTSAERIKNNLITLINDPDSWQNTISDTNDNPTLSCLINSAWPALPTSYATTCQTAGGSTTNPIYSINVIKDAANGGGNSYYSIGQFNGFTQAGVPCNSYSSSGNDGCPIQVTINWQPICPSGATSCAYPQVFVQVNMSYSPTLKNRVPFNASNHSVGFIQGTTPGVGCWQWDQAHNLMYETCAPKVGIGTVSPGVNLDMHVANAPSVALSITNDGGPSSVSASFNLTSYSSVFGGLTGINFMRARGTSSSPQGLQANDVLYQLGAYGYNGTGFDPNQPAIVDSEEQTAVPAGPIPGNTTMIDLLTRSAGSASPVSRLHLASVGYVGIGTTNPLAAFHLDSQTTSPIFRVSSPITSQLANACFQLYDDTPSGASGYSMCYAPSPSTNSTPGIFELNYDQTNNVAKQNILAATSTGLVGVGGQTNPMHALDVKGDINLTGNFLINNTIVCSGTACNAQPASSDARLKKEVAPLEHALKKSLLLRGVSYFWKDEKKFSPGRQIGLIAQEVEKIFSEVVRTDSKTGMKSIFYDRLIAPLVEALKELKARVVADDEAKRKKMSDLKAEDAEIEARLGRLEQRAGKAGQ